MVLDTGAKAKKHMKKRVRYTDEPMGDILPIADLLPPPEVLSQAPRRVRVTLELDAESLALLKQQAADHHVHYQKMIGSVLNAYAHRHTVPDGI